MFNKKLLPLNLQFFAENSEGGNGEGNNSQQEETGNQSQEGANQSGEDGQNNGQQAKTFTQEEMTATATKEKKEGKNSILKMFGIKDEKSAKEEAAAYKQWKESQKTEEQKQQENVTQLENDKTAAENRAILAENKLSAFTAGVNKDSIDDALAIASLKVTEDKSLDAVLEEMKSQPKYKGFFESEGDSSNQETGGTGSNVGHNNKNGNSSSNNIGKRLAEQNKARSAVKSSYFKN